MEKRAVFDVSSFSPLDTKLVLKRLEIKNEYRTHNMALELDNQMPLIIKTLSRTVGAASKKRHADDIRGSSLNQLNLIN